MAIRPVDMQSVMPRAVEGSRTNANEAARPTAEQQQFSQQVQKNANNEQQSVIQSNKSEGRSIDKDGKGNSSGYKGNRQRRRGTDKDESEQSKEKKSMLDISL